MKIVGVIPARYGSSRFEGKPLADIFGKPMIWWTYNRVLKVKELEEVYVATDDERIKDVCEQYNMNVILTSKEHPTHVHRIQEVAQHIEADLYVCVCGDEPIIDYEIIPNVIPRDTDREFLVSALMREILDPTEVIDPAKIKIITKTDNYALALSRTPIPFPYKSLEFKYKKIIGVECYNRKALDFFVNTEKGPLEMIEDVTLLRYLEHGIDISFSLVDSYELAVDTRKDLERVKLFMQENNIQ